MRKGGERLSLCVMCGGEGWGRGEEEQWDVVVLMCNLCVTCLLGQKSLYSLVKTTVYHMLKQTCLLSHY